MKIKILKTTICIILLVTLQACGTINTHRQSSSKSKNSSKNSHTTHIKTGAYKSNVTATYYHDKFNGRKTASGAVFSNSKLTTAHPSLPFGTKLKVTDRGPFTKGRELDLTKKAFMDITDNKNKGLLQVDIEIVE